MSKTLNVVSSLGCKYGGQRLRHMSNKRAPKVFTKGKVPKPKPMEYSPAPRKLAATTNPSQSRPLPFVSRRLPLILASITAFGLASFMGYTFMSYQRIVNEESKEVIEEDVSHRYDDLAPTFDESVNWTETVMGLNRMRKRMAQEATGDVCEVSIGTGRNLTYYDWDFPGFNGVGKPGVGYKIKRGKVKSFTAVDKSAEMLEVAHDKFSREYPGITGVRWVVQDAAKPLPPPPLSSNERSGNKEGKKYDTLIQTMGLCSTSDPVGLLKNLGESVEDDGRILLLEHGRGTSNWVNTWLDGLAARHAREFGCVWNKDIGEIVNESGLDIVKIERDWKHAGTTWWIELRPHKKTVGDLDSLSAAGVSSTATKKDGKSNRL